MNGNINAAQTLFVNKNRNAISKTNNFGQVQITNANYKIVYIL